MAPADQAAAVMDVLAEARAEADSIRRQALEEGYAAGRHEALEALAPALGRSGRRRRACVLQQASAAEELERRAVELGLALAAEGARRRVERRARAGAGLRPGALRGIVERERIIIMVNPDDLEIVKGAAEELKATLGGIEHCVIEAERRVGRGGCIVRTPVGDVDARVETKLERASEVVAAALGRSP